MLRKSSRIQPPSSARVQIIPAAAGKSIEIRTFCIGKRARATNYIAGYGGTQTGGVVEEQSVLTVTLDWLAEQLPPPDLIKIDVEGAEFEVLSGARLLLQEKRPIILCEVCKEKSEAVTGLLNDHKYTLFDGERPRSARNPVSMAPWSTIAVPS